MVDDDIDAAEPPPLWTAIELARFLGLSPKTVLSLNSTHPERLPPRVAHMPSLRWVPAACQAWALTPSAKRPRVGRPRKPWPP